MSFFMRYVAGVMILSLGVTAAAGFLSPVPAGAAPSIPATAPLAPSPLPAVDRTPWPSLVERSPFIATHAAFSRNAGPPAPEIAVRLAGIFKVGKEMRASLIVGNETLMVRKGDQTPVGAISKIESAAVEIEGDPPRRIELFKQ